ncbi:hypothetical protein FOA52_013330 [Chlamydomonas sp. UWO 241]|nr:hypothetical protein FOA52_013330 [Chlamydomonas sp. UWO 241]
MMIRFLPLLALGVLWLRVSLAQQQSEVMNYASSVCKDKARQPACISCITDILDTPGAAWSKAYGCGEAICQNEKYLDGTNTTGEAECASCLASGIGKAWGCEVCLDFIPETAPGKRTACFECVKDDPMDGLFDDYYYACAMCANFTTTAATSACKTCLDNAHSPANIRFLGNNVTFGQCVEVARIAEAKALKIVMPGGLSTMCFDQFARNNATIYANNAAATGTAQALSAALLAAQPAQDLEACINCVDALSVDDDKHTFAYGCAMYCMNPTLVITAADGNNCRACIQASEARDDPWACDNCLRVSTSPDMLTRTTLREACFKCVQADPYKNNNFSNFKWACSECTKIEDPVLSEYCFQCIKNETFQIFDMSNIGECVDVTSNVGVTMGNGSLNAFERMCFSNWTIDILFDPVSGQPDPHGSIDLQVLYMYNKNRTWLEEYLYGPDRAIGGGDGGKLGFEYLDLHVYGGLMPTNGSQCYDCMQDVNANFNLATDQDRRYGCRQYCMDPTMVINEAQATQCISCLKNPNVKDPWGCHNCLGISSSNLLNYTGSFKDYVNQYIQTPIIDTVMRDNCLTCVENQPTGDYNWTYAEFAWGCGMCAKFKNDVRRGKCFDCLYAGTEPCTCVDKPPGTVDPPFGQSCNPANDQYYLPPVPPATSGTCPDCPAGSLSDVSTCTVQPGEQPYACCKCIVPGYTVDISSNKCVCASPNFLNGEVCAPCAATFVAKIDGTGCECPAGSSSSGGICVCNGTTILTNGACVACPSTYLPNTAHTACECPAGSVYCTSRNKCGYPLTLQAVNDNCVGADSISTTAVGGCFEKRANVTSSNLLGLCQDTKYTNSTGKCNVFATLFYTTSAAVKAAVTDVFRKTGNTTTPKWPDTCFISGGINCNCSANLPCLTNLLLSGMESSPDKSGIIPLGGGIAYSCNTLVQSDLPWGFANVTGITPLCCAGCSPCPSSAWKWRYTDTSTALTAYTAGSYLRMGNVGKCTKNGASCQEMMMSRYRYTDNGDIVPEVCIRASVKQCHGNCCADNGLCPTSSCPGNYLAKNSAKANHVGSCGSDRYNFTTGFCNLGSPNQNTVYTSVHGPGACVDDKKSGSTYYAFCDYRAYGDGSNGTRNPLECFTSGNAQHCLGRVACRDGSSGLRTPCNATIEKYEGVDCFADGNSENWKLCTGGSNAFDCSTNNAYWSRPACDATINSTCPLPPVVFDFKLLFGPGGSYLTYPEQAPTTKLLNNRPAGCLKATENCTNCHGNCCADTDIGTCPDVDVTNLCYNPDFAHVNTTDLGMTQMTCTVAGGSTTPATLCPVSDQYKNFGKTNEHMILQFFATCDLYNKACVNGTANCLGRVQCTNGVTSDRYGCHPQIRDWEGIDCFTTPNSRSQNQYYICACSAATFTQNACRQNTTKYDPVSITPVGDAIEVPVCVNCKLLPIVYDFGLAEYTSGNEDGRIGAPGTLTCSNTTYPGCTECHGKCCAGGGTNFGTCPSLGTCLLNNLGVTDILCTMDTNATTTITTDSNNGINADKCPLKDADGYKVSNVQYKYNAVCKKYNSACSPNSTNTCLGRITCLNAAGFAKVCDGEISAWEGSECLMTSTTKYTICACTEATFDNCQKANVKYPIPVTTPTGQDFRSCPLDT